MNETILTVLIGMLIGVSYINQIILWKILTKINNIIIELDSHKRLLYENCLNGDSKS